MELHLGENIETLKVKSALLCSMHRHAPSSSVSQRETDKDPEVLRVGCPDNGPQAGPAGQEADRTQLPGTVQGAGCSTGTSWAELWSQQWPGIHGNVWSGHSRSKVGRTAGPPPSTWTLDGAGHRRPLDSAGQWMAASGEQSRTLGAVTPFGRWQPWRWLCQDLSPACISRNRKSMNA